MKRIRPEFKNVAAAGEVTVTDYFYAGTARAHEALGGECADVSCVNCGAKISHVFMTEIGPLGGDCAATITGDNATRSAVRRYLPKFEAKAGNGRASRIWTEESGDLVAVWMQVRCTGYVREYDGAVVGARVECLAVVTDRVAKLLLGALADSLSGDPYVYQIAA